MDYRIQNKKIQIKLNIKGQQVTIEKKIENIVAGFSFLWLEMG